ncbi:MAG TPA: sigma-54 dependent transcriptional regulator [Bdellovibrionota bacterium]|jgi:two-component system response regulator PilR (NtrC family)|nr:sigma-54 dependent transcriptional regulator [Bdellovibrionota bacterium]
MSSEIRPKILVVDDEASIREFLQIMLKRERMVVEVAENGRAAWEKLQTQSFDLVISDIQMPEMTGIELLEKIKTKDPGALVLMITAFGSTDVAVQAMKLGAYDFLTKPFKIDDVKLRIHNALEKRTLVLDNVRLRKELGERYAYSSIIGGSKPMLDVFEMIKRVAPTNSSILVTGESGTGKELVAKAVHYNSDRKDGPFVSVNCGAIPEELIESELFGHVKGSFTGAIRDKKGFFEIANGGTLFLDEIGELPLSMQATLLRALSDGTFIPVGADESLKSNVRIVAATNRNLEDEVREQNFREDLYFRLNVINIRLPALRERRDDIPMLLDFFVEKFSESFGKKITAIPTETVKLLGAYTWPGNVRELENVIERMMALESSGSLTVEGVPENIREPMKPRFDSLAEYLKWDKSGVELEEILSKIEREYILKAIDEAGGSRKKAAKLLGVTMRSLRYRLEKFGLSAGDE